MKANKAQIEHAKRENCEWCWLRVYAGAFPRMCDEWYRLETKKRKTQTV